MHPAALSDDELARQCEIKRTRGSGPGGQHRNKVETAIVITHTPSGIRGEASERRSQSQNLEVAWQRLRVALALGVRLACATDTPLSPRWQTHLRGGKIHISPDHDDFGPILAEVLDRLALAVGDVASVAERLGVSSSQLIKFLKLEPLALQRVNDARRAQGVHPLK